MLQHVPIRRLLGAATAVAALTMTGAAPAGAADVADTRGPVSASSTSANAAPSLRKQVVTKTNQLRADKGCRHALKVSKKLNHAAQYHAADMSKRHYFSHNTKGGPTWDKRIRSFGWKNPGGENIAYGFESAAAVMRGWMDSPGHRRNLLDCSFRYIGVGHAASGDFWVQDFGY